jgi:hypothetical protein
MKKKAFSSGVFLSYGYFLLCPTVKVMIANTSELKLAGAICG